MNKFVIIVQDVSLEGRKVFFFDVGLCVGKGVYKERMWLTYFI